MLLFSYETEAQTTGASIKGKITELNGQALPHANISIDSLNINIISDINGYYTLNNLPRGAHNIKVEHVGYKPVTRRITVSDKIKSVSTLDVILEEEARTLQKVEIQAKTQAEKIRESGYSVNVIETQAVQDREVTLNQLVSRSPGIRVRESGGLGSSANYSLDGMSGRSVRFFIDGIPLDRFGAAYGINNFPVNLIDRIEIYKGVVPPQFGSDALGGIINLVTKTKKQKYLDASYSYSSFNTHRAALSTRWVHDRSNFYVDAQAFHNYSDNNYWVWGKGVEVDGGGGRAIGIKTRRFHDDYRSSSGKLGFGFFDKKWADQFQVNMIAAGSFSELQTRTTMASVVGEATRSDNSYAPSLFYAKRKLFGTALDATLYSSVSFQKTRTVDTSSRIYNWLGAVISELPNNSELGSGSRGKSLLTLQATNWFQQVSLSYPLHDGHKISLNYTFDRTDRDGEDPFIGSRTASSVDPQYLQKQIVSLAYELKTGPDLSHSFWVKNYDLSVSTVRERYITDSLGYRPVAYPETGSDNNFGYGYALKYDLNERTLLKFSAEKAYRLPDAEEMLGDGLFTRANPDLKPEQSFNFNMGALFRNIELSDKSKLNIEFAVFFRNISNQLLYLLRPGGPGVGGYQNVDKVKSYGASVDAMYRYGERLSIKGNATYQQSRDWKEFIGSSRNLTYRDLLPNTPFFMSNGECSYTVPNFLREQAELSLFWETLYVQMFYLNWPSLGNQNKADIPSQLVHNSGISYSMESGKYNIGIGSQNIFNELAYDNYMLQKPGRSFYIKLRVLIK